MDCFLGKFKLRTNIPGKCMASKIEDCVILYLEDDDPTAYLFQIALQEAGFSPRLVRVSDQNQATAFLYQMGIYSDARKPDLIILDLNLPMGNGLEVLAEVKGSPNFSEIPTYVFTSSHNPRDHAMAISLGANGYLSKGNSLSDFVTAAKTVCECLTNGSGQMDLC